MAHGPDFREAWQQRPGITRPEDDGRDIVGARDTRLTWLALKGFFHLANPARNRPMNHLA